MIILMIIAFIAILVIAAWLTMAFMSMQRWPEIHIWPAANRCRICRKRVFVWQRRKMVEYSVLLDNPRGWQGTVEAWGLAHCSCIGKGLPIVQLKIN